MRRTTLYRHKNPPLMNRHLLLLSWSVVTTLFTSECALGNEADAESAKRHSNETIYAIALDESFLRGRPLSIVVVRGSSRSVCPVARKHGIEQSEGSNEALEALRKICMEPSGDKWELRHEGPVSYLDEKEVYSLLEKPDGSQVPGLSAKYGNPYAFAIWFSKIGYSRSGDHAALKIQMICGGLCHGAWTVVLKKVENGWEPISTTGTGYD